MSEHLRAEFDACLKGISLRENALHRELCETRASLNEARDNFGRQHRQLLEAEQQNAALLAEVARLKARLTITDELLKTAARAAREAAGVNSKTMRNLREHYLDSWMTVTRAALLAAGMEAQP